MIEVHNLTKQFPMAGGPPVVAVDGVSFSVAAGEVYGWLGPNGAGKTTTLRMILGLLSPTSGYATVAGFHSTRQPDEVKRRVGLVSASAGVYQWLSVREMLLFFADLYGVPPARAGATLAELSGLLGLEGLLERRCVSLSTGQKQRVNLARALIHDPPVMLLDEPTLGLDVVGSQMIMEYVGYLRGQGKAVIMSTHRLDEAERVCQRFGLLHRGRLVSEGTLDDLRARSGCNTLVEMFLKLSHLGDASLLAARGNGEPNGRGL
jgi:ABC-2 type transport system ATP-binding protein/sodium transport system ATP-binding protein